jgi:ABC-type sugar transport system ATPase subunit
VTSPASATATRPALELRGISKSYGHVAALREVDLVVNTGEMLGIVGDNGAGKSTMLKIISGVVIPDAGQILIDGKAVAIATPTDARAHGIATVFQDLALVECLDVATNMSLGMIPRKGPFVDRARMRAEASQVLADLDIRIGSVTMPVGLLSGGQRQIVAVARAIRMDSAMMLLDEPTAALGVRETAHVARIITGLRKTGKTVVCISHDLEFVFAHLDRIAVMRLGRCVAVRDIARTSREEVIGLITGAIAGDTTGQVADDLGD